MSNNLENIAETLSSLTVLELSELSKMLEEKWGVSAAAAVAVAAPAAGGSLGQSVARTRFKMESWKPARPVLMTRGWRTPLKQKPRRHSGWSLLMSASASPARHKIQAATISATQAHRQICRQISRRFAKMQTAVNAEEGPNGIKTRICHFDENNLISIR